MSDIRLEGVTKRYGLVAAADGVDLAVAQGEFVTILGPSGSGKTTLLSLIAGLNRPTAGRIRIDGQEVDGPHESLGVVFQRDLLLDWRSVLDNVLLQVEMRGLPPAKYADAARELLAMVGLQDFHSRYPRELSGGMRQRVSICRALVHNPALLLMDEPFGALDAISRDRLNVDLDRMSSETRKTVIFITHSITEAVFLGDRVVVMSPRPGRVVADIAIDAAHPRDLSFRESPEFAGYVRQVRRIFEAEGVL